MIRLVALSIVAQIRHKAIKRLEQEAAIVASEPGAVIPSNQATLRTLKQCVTERPSQ
jgi:hypothetical protein